MRDAVFDRFRPFCGFAPAGYDRDFIGSKIRQAYWNAPRRDTDMVVDAARPPVDEEYFEWIDLLESVEAAEHGSYTMIELGAGYGRWAVRAALAARQRALRVFLVAVEPEPTHFQWLLEHVGVNDIRLFCSVSLISAAVSDIAGTDRFYVGNAEATAPDKWYGQCLASSELDGCEIVPVTKVTLNGILDNVLKVDLIDFDIQGEELKTIAAAIELLEAKAKLLHIGTHSQEIEHGLRLLLESRGWLCLADYSLGHTHDTPYGRVAFVDGVQTWKNTAL